MLNKVSQAERETPHVLVDMWNPKSSHSKTLNWSVGWEYVGQRYDVRLERAV